ncbi:hypothetical protein ACFLZE_03705 [Thermodesulfobacteriota bacterium]
MNDIHKLTDALLKLEKAGPQPKLRKQLEDLFLRVTPKLWLQIDQLRGEIDKIRARRIDTKVEERFDEEGISIPFPQRDLHIRTLPREMPPVATSGDTDRVSPSQEPAMQESPRRD